MTEWRSQSLISGWAPPQRPPLKTLLKAFWKKISTPQYFWWKQQHASFPQLPRFNWLTLVSTWEKCEQYFPQVLTVYPQFSSATLNITSFKGSGHQCCWCCCAYDWMKGYLVNPPFFLLSCLSWVSSSPPMISIVALWDSSTVINVWPNNIHQYINFCLAGFSSSGGTPKHSQGNREVSSVLHVLGRPGGLVPIGHPLVGIYEASWPDARATSTGATLLRVSPWWLKVSPHL